jgi:hypothetical protein
MMRAVEVQKNESLDRLHPNLLLNYESLATFASSILFDSIELGRMIDDDDEDEEVDVDDANDTDLLDDVGEKEDEGTESTVEDWCYHDQE